MIDPSDLGIWVLVWALAAIFVIIRHWRPGRGVGLVLAYVLSLTAIHWLAPVGYLLPWSPGGSPEWVATGMRVAAIGMVGFAVGAEIMGWLLRSGHGFLSSIGRKADEVDEAGQALAVSPLVVNLYLAAGFALHAMVMPLAAGIPSVAAVIATGSTLIVIGLGMKCWNAWLEGDLLRIWLWLAASMTLPAITVATQGYLGYGMAAMLTVFAFVAAFSGARWKVVIAGTLIAYLGLSVYVTYMRDRSYIRSSVWGGDPFSRRIDEITYTVSRFEWFSPFRPEHLHRINERLNQNFFVGASVWYLSRAGAPPFAHGETLIQAFEALVPRILWPDKPIAAGSGDLVADYTGFVFGRNTSVGIGHVMEFYVNFGVPGVVTGFLIFGALFVLVDQRAASALHRGDPTKFVAWYLPGIAFLQVGGSLVEATSTAGAGLVIAAALNMFLRYSPPTAPAQHEDEDVVGAKEPEAIA